MRSLGAWLLRKTSRDTTSGQFIAEIDGLRFIAIMSVVLFHLAGNFTSAVGRVSEPDVLAALLSRGDVGVKLFFAISGFVIALPFAKGHLFGERIPRLGAYFSRRLTRLEPPYIVNLLIMFALFVFVAHRPLQTVTAHLFASMFYLHNVTYGAMSTINTVAWSLEIEFQFYALAPLIATLFLIRRTAWRRGVLAFAIASFAILALTMGDRSPRFILSILAYAQFFLTGFLLCDIYLVDWQASAPRASLRWDALSIAAWISIFALTFEGDAGMFFLPPAMLLAYCAAFKGTWSNRFFRHPIIYTIGGMCYTIYLYHFQVIQVFDRIYPRLPILRTIPVWLAITSVAIVVVPVSLAFSAVFFILIEKPCMKKNWHRRLIARFRPSREMADSIRAPLA